MTLSLKYALKAERLVYAMQVDKEQVEDKISLVITSFNRAEMLKRAVDSALSQNYKNKEIIISDNCSTDGTNEILKQFASHPNIIINVNKKNLGAKSNFEVATNELATGKYITYLSCDDELINNSFLDDGARAFQSEKVKIVHAQNVSRSTDSSLDIDDYSYKFYKNSYYKIAKVPGRRIFQDYPYCHSISFGGSIYRRTDIIRLSPFKGSCFSNDVLLNLQLIQEGDVFFLDQPTYRVYRHGENFTSLVHEASVYIENLEYIIKPFKKAVSMGEIEERQLYFWLDMMVLNYFLVLKPHLSKAPDIFRKFHSEINSFLNANNLKSISFKKILLWKLLKLQAKVNLIRIDKKGRKN